MDKEREIRYKEKLVFVSDKIESIPENPETSVEKDATFYRIQVAIESATDLVAMVVKDLGKTVGDDYHNLEILQEEKVIDKKLSDELKKLNGLRNVLVHKYNKIEEKLIFDDMNNIIRIVSKLLELVEDVIKKL
ncbi:MAG: DUF86 domain-containing protein [Candidatus Aenigmarchaeota archaeon]|nr:DUF86 domain-containing protein [Candidatus Aenigmarchaeota archaeon]